MPTAARLVATVLLAGLGWIMSEMIRPMMPEGTGFGSFNYVNMGIGAALGWFMMGKRAGLGTSAAISNGLTTCIAFAFWGLFIQAGNRMLENSLKRRYDGPVEGIESMFEIFVEYGMILITPHLAITLLVGCVVSALLTERAWFLWN